MPPDTIPEAFLRDPWFGALPPALQADIALAARRRSYRPGSHVHRRGDPPGDWYGLAAGRIRVCNTLADGRELLLTLLEPGTWFGEISLIDGGPRTHDSRVVEPAELWLVDAAALHGLLERHRAFYPALLRLACARLRRTFGWIDDAVLLTLPQRLAKLLLGLAGSRGEWGGGVPGSAGSIGLKIAQEELGLMLGVGRQAVNRVLKDFERRGWIALRYEGLELRERAALADFGGL